MVNILAIMRKEVRLYFASPMAYVVTAAFLVLMGYLFSLLLFFGQEASLQGVFDNMSIIFAFLAPALTMRLFAEENRSGTLELLLTSPVRDIEVVLGKFLASLAFLLALLLPTLYYVFLISIYGNPDFGPIITSYLGAFLMGAAYLSVGLLASSLTQNQIIAFLMSVGVLLVLWLMAPAAQLVAQFELLGTVLRYLDVQTHFAIFERGLIDTRHIIYFFSITVLALFFTVRSLETRRWA